MRTIVVSVGVGVCAGVGAVLFRVGDVYRRDVTTFRSCEKVGDVMQLYSRELARHEAERREP